MPRIVKQTRLSNLLQFARGDYFKKYAPDSEYNSTKEGRIVRDAVSKQAPIREGQRQTRSGMEAMVRADIKTDLSGKHSAHRAEVAKMEKDHAQRQGYMKQQGLHAEAAAEHISHTKAVVDKERDYADSFLGKKKIEPPVTTGMTTEKQRKRGERIFKKAPHKIISQADQQSALNDRAKFSGSMAEELRTNSNILRSARKQVGAKDVRAANTKLTQVMPGLKGMVEERVKHETRLDPQRAAALKRKVKAGAATRMASTAGKIGENDNLNRRVHEVTEPLFTPKSIDPERESVTWDREAIAKKIGVKPHIAEKIKTRYAHLAHEQASRAESVRKRVIKEGSAFSPLRSAANASHDYPFLARNARRLKGIGAAAGLAAAGTGALLIRKKKPEPQLQMAARSRIIQLASEPLPVHRVKRIVQGIRRHTISKLQQEGMIRVPLGKATMNPPGFSASESEVDALRRRLSSANEAAKNNPVKHSKKLHEVRDRHAEAMEGLKKAHAEERERLIGDVKTVRGNERRIGKRRLIIGSTAAGTAGAVAGHETGKKKEVQFGVADIGRRIYSAIETSRFVTENRLGRALRKAAPVGSKRRAEVGIAKDWGRGALTGIPGGAEAGAVKGAIGASGRIPSIRNRQIEKTMKRIAMKPSIHMQARDWEADIAMVSHGLIDIRQIIRKYAPIYFDAIQSLRNRLRPDDKQSAGHDILTGGLEGSIGLPVAMNIESKLRGHGWINPIARKTGGWPGLGKSMLIGGAVGAGMTGLIGSAVSRINKKREDMEPVQFASAVARDRYTKGIHENDQAHAESNYLRTGLAGGALASLLAKGPMSKRFLGGAAAGIGVQAATRAYTAGTKDQFGDRSYAGKRIDKAPHEIAGLAAAGIVAKRGLEKWDAAKPVINRIKTAVGKVGKVGRYFGLTSKLQLIQLDEETDRRLERAKRGSYRQAETLYNRAGRAGRLIRDTKTAITGGKNVDSRGRERTPEWKKPWVKKAVGLGITAVGIRHAHNLVKSNKGDIAGAVGRFMRQDASLGHKTGVAVPLSGLQKLARAHPEISRPIIRARREVRGIVRDTKDVMSDKKDEVIKRWTGKTPGEAAEAAKAGKATNKEAASEEVKRKLRQVRSVNPGQKPPTITKFKAIEFAQTLDDWDISHRSRNTAVIRVPGAQKRDRRQKTYSETAEGQRMLRNVGIGAGATAGVIGTNYIKNRVQAAKETAVDKGWKQSGVTQTGVPLHTSGGPVEDAAAKAAARKARQTATRKIIRQSRRDFRLEIVPNRLIQLNYKLDAILTA